MQGEGDIIVIHALVENPAPNRLHKRHQPIVKSRLNEPFENRSIALHVGILNCRAVILGRVIAIPKRR